jgi:hypothetical protein
MLTTLLSTLPLPVPVLIALPCLLWTQGPESAPALKSAGVDRICVASADPQADWRAAGVTVQVLPADDAGSRDALTTPGIAARAGLGSPTRVPWVNANGWQYRRKPAGKFAYDVQAGRGPLAAAEAFMYDGDAVLKIDPADLAETGRMLAFLRTVPAAPGLTDVADLAVVDDGGPMVGEVMNLLERRNLMFQIVKKPTPRYPINIVLGSPKYPQADAADPSGFALKIRHQLTDARRSLRIFGSEVVVARLTRNARRVRLQLLNYSGRELQGLRIRLRGTYRLKESFILSAAPSAAAAAAMATDTTGTPATPPPAGKVTDLITTAGATEFSVSAMGAYAVIDLTPAAGASKAATH